MTARMSRAHAVEAANMRKAEREIARYLGGPGAKFTDESEREIERLLTDCHR
jgi:hypothetical protein